MLGLVKELNQIGNAIAESISQEKMREYESKEKDKEMQRNMKEKELTDFLGEIKKIKRAKNQELSNIQQDVGRRTQVLNVLKDTQEKEIKKQSQAMQDKDQDFKNVMAEKEKALSKVMGDLAEAKSKTKEEKKKQEIIEDQIDDAEAERERMMGEVERLDDEIDAAEEDDDNEDKDLALDQLKDDDKIIEDMIKKINQQLKEQDEALNKLKDEKNQLDNEHAKLTDDMADFDRNKVDLDALNNALAQALDEESKHFEASNNLITDLKGVETESFSKGKGNLELEAMINKLTEQNFVERKARSIENQIRNFEDKIGEKRRIYVNINRNLDRLNDIVDIQEIKQKFNLSGFQDKIQQLDKDLTKFEKLKEELRAKKLQIEKPVIGKQIEDLTKEMLKKCADELALIEQELDTIILDENDILIIDRLKKNFDELLKKFGDEYYKKTKVTKEKQEDKLVSNKEKLDKIYERAKKIESEKLVDVSKIADDDDEIEILKGKTEILKEIKRAAVHIQEKDIDETQTIKLQRIVLKKDDIYEQIEQWKEMEQVVVEITGVEKDVNQLETRLNAFEMGLKQFEVELKLDFYQDSVQEVSEQFDRLQKFESQLRSLNEGIASIEDALSQSQSKNNYGTDSNQQEIEEMEKAMIDLKKLRNTLEGEKKDLNKDGNILKSELANVDLDNLDITSPTHFQDMDQEIIRQRDVISQQENNIKGALQQMAAMKETSQSLAFQKKAEKRQECKQKLKRIIDNLDEIEQLLSEIDISIEIIQKDGVHLRQSEFSPTKGRSKVHYGQNADLEKEQELNKNQKEINNADTQAQRLHGEKMELEKVIRNCQESYDQLDLENSTLKDFEDLLEKLSIKCDSKSLALKERCKDLLDNDLKKLKDIISELIERFKQKRAVLSDCRKEEKDKSTQIQKIINLVNSYKLRLSQMEKELLTQQSMDFKGNQEKKDLFQSYLQDVKTIRDQVLEKGESIEIDRQDLGKITAPLDNIGEKIVTLENLKDIYKQLIEMRNLKDFELEMKKIGEVLQLKEHQIEQFIKDLLGGSLYECERKLKEADQLVEKIAKKTVELNNGMNDFEVDIKKTLQTGKRDKEIEREGKNMIDINNSERKKLKDVEDQKNLIKKVLLKIKNSLNDHNEDFNNKGQKSKENILSTGNLEAIIAEIETCVKKGQGHLKNDLGQIENDLNERRSDWNKWLFKSGEKEQLIEDINKTLKDNLHSLEDLDSKLKEVNHMLRGFEEVIKQTIGNPDYEIRQGQYQKMEEANAESRQLQKKIEEDQNNLIEVMKKLNQQKDALKNQSTIQELNALSKSCYESRESLSKLNKEADNLVKSLQKRRQKIGDADIMDNFKTREQDLSNLENMLKDMDKEAKELDNAMTESLRLNPDSEKEIRSQQNKVKADLNKAIKDKEELESRLAILREKLKKKDLLREDPYNFSQFIIEIRNLRNLLHQKIEDASKITQQIKIMKNRYGDFDVDQKVDAYNFQLQNQKDRLINLMEEIEILKDLQEEFDGYTSENQEEIFIEKLGAQMVEVKYKHQLATDECETICDQLDNFKKTLQRRKDKGDDAGQLTPNEIEDRANQVITIEEEALKNKRNVDEIDQKVSKNKKVFMQMQIKEKFKRRNQELRELSKRLENFQSQVNELSQDIQIESSKIKYGTDEGDELAKVFEEMNSQIYSINLEYDTIGSQLISIDQELVELKDSQKYHQFELLKGNIRIKKSILKALDQIKQTRLIYNSIKSKFDIHKQKASYKAAKGDQVDQLLGDWLNTNACPVPIKRLGGGYYMFGTKKIFAKVINGKLVIRVGGGYMGVEEFMFYYGAQELNKMLAYQQTDEQDDDAYDIDEALEGKKDGKDMLRRNSKGVGVIGIAQMKKRLSPHQMASPRANSRGGNRENSPGSTHTSQHKSRQSNYSPRSNNASELSIPKQTTRNTFQERKSPKNASFLQRNTMKNKEEKKF